MTKISVVFLFTFVLFSSGIQAKSLVDGMKNEREMQQDEIPSQEPLFENSRFPVGYGDGNGYSKIGPLYDMSNYRTEVMKRSLREHNPTQRQTGIIYGGGKPIGILQPYQESFKFMPIREERVYSLDGGRSNVDQQEPYINLMYPLARFTRSEDAIRMAELEAAKAEFLDKHYPSMLVDFKIHNKLHPTGYSAKAVPTYNIKREETNTNNNEMRKRKRESQAPSQPIQKLHKRDNQHVMKRESNSQQKSEQTAPVQKRENKIVHKREEKKNAPAQKRQTTSEFSNAEQNKLKMKRQSKLTDTEFENLKNSVSKRNSNENIQVIEEDLKGLLSDMGLIEDDLEENAEEMEESKSAVVQDEDLEEGFDTTIQKDKEEPQVEQKRDSSNSPERKKRADDHGNGQTSIPLSETRNFDSKKRTLNDIPNKRSVPDVQDNGKRFIELSFSTKDNKDSVGGSVNEADACPKPSAIPNKREITNEGSSENKQERSISRGEKSKSKRSEETAAVTTETYEQYEQRVAREIKSKIKQLKEEVKRELGALESDKDEEDDEDSVGETQRKKRFIMNTLLDEESHNIDPNENLENSELEPHVRRRRTLSTDMMSFGPQKSSLNSFDKNSVPEVNLMNFDPMSVVQNKFDFDDGYYGDSDSRSQSFSNPSSYVKDDITKKDILHSKARTRKANDYNPYMVDNTGSRNYRWDDPSIYMKAPGKMFVPEYQRRMPSKYVALTSRRNLRNDLNAEGGNFNSDYESDVSNTNTDEEAEANMNTVVDMTRKATERKSDARQQISEEHAPKKLQGYNQKYFYYYVGGNENEKKENVAPSSGNGQRASSMYNYQRLAGQYPNQFYKSMNRLQNKQYTKSTNENALTNKRAFQRRFDKPFGRRRKRYANLMIPSENKDAIVSNVVYRNSSMPLYPNFSINNRLGGLKFPFHDKTMTGAMERIAQGDHMDQNATSDGSWSNLKKSPPTEKGKNITTTDHDPSARNALVPWNSPMKKNEGQISGNEPKTTEETTGNSRENRFRNDNPYAYPNGIFMKNSKRSWYGRDYMNPFRNSNFNLYSMSQLNQIRRGKTPIAEKSQEEKKNPSYVQEEKLNGRKMLSWQEGSNYTENCQENLNAAQDSQIIPNRDKDNKSNSAGNRRYNTIMDEDYRRDGEAEDYEESYYVDSSSTSTFTNADLATTTTTPETRKPISSTNHPAEDKVTVKNSIVKGDISKREQLKATDQNDVSVLSTPTYSLSDLVVNKNNLYVQNASLLSAEWKRRKREIQSEDQQTRSKRSWFWPSLSFLHNNAPQIEEDDEFQQEQSPMNQDRQSLKRSGDKSSFSFEEDTDGDEEFDDFANDPSGYDRDKRDTGSRSFYPGDKAPYYYTNKGGLNSYLPVSRNRRYVQGEFRQPQQQLLTEISDAELFGALPQGYTGELARYKRVKRTDREADKT